MTRKIAMLSGAAVAAMMLAATPSFAQQHPGQEPSTTTTAQPAMNDQMQNQNSTAAPTTQNSMSSSQSSMSGSTIALSKVQDPKNTLAQATVQDSTGTQVGQVQSVETSSSGTPLKVDITLQTTAGANKTVAIPASKLRYDESARVIRARLSQSEIEAMQPSSGANPM
ncbi:MAG TPA: hypothetical protein VHW02_04155 [Rhizomicrobium sp.]|nr:hypothetical protein [Rhizomicrobium sp.]